MARSKLEQEDGLEKGAAKVIIKEKERKIENLPSYQSYAFTHTHTHTHTHTQTCALFYGLIHEKGFKKCFQEFIDRAFLSTKNSLEKFQSTSLQK